MTLDVARQVLATEADAIRNLVDLIGDEIRAGVDPASVGLFFQPVRQKGMQAGGGSTDFTQLFVGLSFFLVIAAVLLTAGTKGKRNALPNSRIMIHQPLGGFQGQATDIEIHAKEILLIRERLNAILAHHTGRDLDSISQDTDRDNFMSAEQSVAYGLIDEVLDRRAVQPS